ncbi:MAG: glycosyl hydrolase 115 family protein [Firmicutes bacterium]|nr:glycosyl hydrolase 115 family protein [Bacillota bacterium]
MIIYKNTTFSGIFCTPVQTAVDNVKRDMEEILTEEGQSTITFVVDKTMTAESWKMEAGEESLTITAPDDFGCIYALYYLSENYLGVQPMWFWNDQIFQNKPWAEVPAGVYESTPYRVRFRGWFINDHQLLHGWTEKYKDEKYVWARIYETVMRLGGNMMITASYRDVDGQKKLIADYGMYISHTHNEPLGSDMFVSMWPGVNPSLREHPDKFEALWRDAVIRQKEYKMIWGVGFRGQGDRNFWDDDPVFDTDEKRGALIEQAIRKQIDIVKEYVENPAFCTNLYGEMTELYRKGDLKFPEEVIKIWGDSGFGRMVSRRQLNSDPRTDAMPTKGSGKNGMYYHASFHDLQASNHLTMSPNSAEFLARELETCFENDGDDYLIINCGSVKPHIYTLDLMAKLWRDGKVDVQEHAQDYAQRYYGDHAEQIGQLLPRFSELAPQYASHEDEHAGEQYYHYNARYMIQGLMAGKENDPMVVLKWLGGWVPLKEIAAKMKKTCEETFQRSDAYYNEAKALLEQLSGEEKRLYEESFWVQVVLHNTGLHGLYHMCCAFEEKVAGNWARAYVHAHKASKYYHAGYECMQEMSRGKWTGIYDEDSLTNVEITCYTADILRGWLRICEEGEYYTGWEKEYIMSPDDVRNIGSFNKFKAWSDEKLGDALEEKYDQMHPGSKYSIFNTVDNT